ncbi:MAG: UDP-N-acetylmuramoyl-L-alanyl-D-glutamate--2,6-diaminopimelate ligase [Chloroflexi bacterium HGW-Chloroflexi-1]|nr:MAG: UDP-N-acetylmuramoyl-L-alanyl-D-glutamate--2,6-diaminopimelate ligase [Chloroflexi bacterium HGW-Chloroflexi-1]
MPDVRAHVGDPDVTITRITADSRQVIPGALFVAYRGVGVDGHHFIPDALARGAAAVVGEQDPPGLLSVPYVQVGDGRAALAWLSAAWHDHPSRSMALVGITGTDGKTTTANLLFSILQAAGRRAGLISTVNAVIGDRIYDTGLHTTTPDAPDVQRYLAQMRDAGVEVAVLETTSHGLAQGRVTGCLFDVAVVTNITHEHLDFHGSYEAYRDAKALLFRSLMTGPHKPGFSEKPGLWGLPKTAVLNRDDSSFEFLAAIPAERVITYGITNGKWQRAKGKGQGARGKGQGVDDKLSQQSRDMLTLTASEIRHTPAGATFDIEVIASPNTQYPIPNTQYIPNTQSLIPNIQSPLVGDYNVSNILAAAGAALALGIEVADIQQGVRAVTAVPGRMERIDRGQAFVALVDFAHTPNALANALAAARTLVGPAGRVIVVFGSAGLRDRLKRRMMGETAARLADFAVITAEDPRTEDLAAILAEIAEACAAAGRVEGRDFVRIPDRQRAITHAVGLARPGDVVIVCGKGHEQSMCFGDVEYPWRDQAALGWALEGLRGGVLPPPPFVLPTWT